MSEHNSVMVPTHTRPIVVFMFSFLERMNLIVLDETPKESG